MYPFSLCRDVQCFVFAGFSPVPPFRCKFNRISTSISLDFRHVGPNTALHGFGIVISRRNVNHLNLVVKVDSVLEWVWVVEIKSAGYWQILVSGRKRIRRLGVSKSFQNGSCPMLGHLFPSYCFDAALFEVSFVDGHDDKFGISR
jgi:hypothetical protein